MTQFGQLFASFWQLFSNIQVPILGISFATLYLGVFATTFSILILRPLLGLGNAFANNRVNLTSRMRNASERSANRQFNRDKRADYYKRKAEKEKRGK